MDYCKGKLTKLLVEYFENDFRRITHALEVLKYAEKAAAENTEDFDYEILVASALLHDVGIKPLKRDLDITTGRLRRNSGHLSPKSYSETPISLTKRSIEFVKS